MRDLLRKYPKFFWCATLSALALRLLFILRFSHVTVDSFIYGDIAKNWLQHGTYAISDPSGPAPTYIRLPGYPAFLAAVFDVFGMEHYRAVLFIQMVVDVGTCFLIADLARRMVSARAAKAAFLLAALCPFLANYTATALTETLEIFFTTLALELAICGLRGLEGAGHSDDYRVAKSSSLLPWIGCGLAIAVAILLRPDGGLLLVSIDAYVIWLAVRRVRAGNSRTRLVSAAGIILLCALAPLVPWTVRNLRTMHRFQPLAPRYANEEDEFVPMGFNRWTKTWIADYASVEEIYWQVPGNEVDPEKLPARAFDSETQREQTVQLLQDYNDALHVGPELDRRFVALANERIHHAPLRYYLWLPALRISDMWLRPRTELLPSDTRWWEFNDDPEWSALAVALGVIGLFYVGVAIVGLVRGRFLPHLGLLLTFAVLRSIFLGTLENPEPRYVLECYPVVIVWAAAAYRRDPPAQVIREEN